MGEGLVVEIREGLLVEIRKGLFVEIRKGLFVEIRKGLCVEMREVEDEQKITICLLNNRRRLHLPIRRHQLSRHLRQHSDYLRI
jgi:hypothetical protein